MLSLPESLTWVDCSEAAGPFAVVEYGPPGCLFVLSNEKHSTLLFSTRTFCTGHGHNVASCFGGIILSSCHSLQSYSLCRLTSVNAYMLLWTTSLSTSVYLHVLFVRLCACLFCAPMCLSAHAFAVARARKWLQVALPDDPELEACVACRLPEPVGQELGFLAGRALRRPFSGFTKYGSWFSEGHSGIKDK